MSSEKKNTKTLEDYLIERINKSGYPLEIEISNLLDQEYVVFNTQYYFDEETKEGRSIDIYAIPYGLSFSEKELQPFIVRTELAIECKKSETHAWIFYTRPKISMSSIYMDGQYRTTIPEEEFGFSSESFQWLFKTHFLKLFYDNFRRIAVAYDEIKYSSAGITKSDNSSRKEIFEAINQLVKFTCYEIHQSFNRIAKLPNLSSEYIIIFFPIVVFDGNIYEVIFDSGTTKLKKNNHILVLTNYRCPYCQKVESFLISFVHRSYFSEFIKNMNLDFINLRDKMQKDINELVNRMQSDKKKAIVQGVT
jgi:hypothetical protein